MSERILPVFFALLLLVNVTIDLAGSVEDPTLETNLLTRRGLCLTESSRFSEDWSAEYLIDGGGRMGWRSAERSPFPHVFIFELPEIASVNLLRFNVETSESTYPGISAKDVRVEFSTSGPGSGYITAGDFSLQKGLRDQSFRIKKAEARWIRLSIQSNHGHRFCTELREFEAWEIYELRPLPLIVTFLLLLGPAVGLAWFSHRLFRRGFIRSQPRLPL